MQDLRLPSSAYKVSDVFARGNDKLGYRRVYSFSLPAVSTCPGRSGLCESVCYADRSRSFFAMPTHKRRYAWNLAFSRRTDFQEVLARLLGQLKPGALLRLHVSGDFYSARYAQAWLRALREAPHVTVWVYTRSWRVASIRPVVDELAGLANVHVWFSCDKETGVPTSVPPRVRTAYMQVEPADVSPAQPDLYFRENAIRSDVVKRIGDALVCPVENGSTHTNCVSCRICLTDPVMDPSKRSRRPLQMV